MSGWDRFVIFITIPGFAIPVSSFWLLELRALFFPYNFGLFKSKLQDLEAWKIRSREELAEHQKKITELSMANLDAEIEKWKNGPPGRSKPSGATLGAELNKEGEGGDTVVQEPKEGNEVVEDEDDETGAMLIEEDEERVTVGDTEVNKLVSV